MRFRLPSWIRLPACITPSPRFRVAAAMTATVTSIMLVLAVTDIMPDETGAIAHGRARLADASALAMYALTTDGQVDEDQMAQIFAGIKDRETSLLSAAVREVDGSFSIEIGSHAGWSLAAGDPSTNSQIQVSIFADEAGTVARTVELRFTPLSSEGVLGYLADPTVLFLLIVGVVTFALFWFIVGSVLQHTESGGAVPSRVRTALDTLAEGLLVIDPKGEIVLANSTFVEIVGGNADDLVGQDAGSFPWLAMGDAESITTEFPWSVALVEQRSTSKDMLQLVKSPTDVRTFIVNCSPVLGSGGGARGVLASFEDVTLLEQKKTELSKSKEEAEAANAAKSSFLANMSHEIRTPMNAILGFTDVLRRGLESGGQDRAKYLDTIHSSGKHLLNLINDILDLSKVEAGKLDVETTECPVHKILSETAEVLGVKAAEKGISLTYQTAGPIPPTIQSDPTRLRQIVTNLTGNAIKFTEEGGVMMNVFVSGEGESAKLCIDISDTGIGMTPEVCERIFDPFVQADVSTTRKFGGTGLGLAISKNFCDALGGALNVSSTPGVGSTFTAEIALVGPSPASEWTTAEQYAADHATSRSTGDTRSWKLPARRVLVVDDGDANRKLLQLVLGKAGLRVDGAENGQVAVESVEAASADGDAYDIIFMDMQMPVLDGYGATAMLRSKGYKTPIVALTGNAMKGDEEKCLEKGCSGFLSKPVDLDDLLRTTVDQLDIDQSDVEAAVEKDAVEKDAVEKDAVEKDAAPRPPKQVVAPERPQASQSRSTIRRIADLPPIHSTLLEDEDPEFIEIVDGFVEKLNSQLEAMCAAISGSDFQQLSELAHWLKGAGGTMGFAEFTAPSRQLEVASIASDAETARLLVAGLQTLHDRIEIPTVDFSMQ